MITLIVLLVAFAGGFAVGRIKNADKLKAIGDEVKSLEDKAKGLAQVAATDVMAAIVYIKTKVF